jgi:hypothetical protein
LNLQSLQSQPAQGADVELQSAAGQPVAADLIAKPAASGKAEKSEGN